VVFTVALTLLVSYLLGCFNGSVMTSHFIIRDDVRQHGSGSLHAGILADAPAHDLAAGAADHKNVPGLKMRSLQQFFRSLPRLRRRSILSPSVFSPIA